MKRLEHMKENLINIVECELSHPESVDTKELGEAIDMIKDLEETMYYCSIVKAMEETEYNQRYYTPYIRYIEPYLENGDIDRRRMYYEDPRHANGLDKNRRVHYYDDEKSIYHDSYPAEIRDYREGKSPMSRKGYLESKETHKDKHVQMQELEKYMQELSSDITEMISDSTPEEKTLLQQKLNMLVSKIK